MHFTLKIGLVAFVIGGLLRLADLQSPVGHFASGFFLGLSIVLMIAGSYHSRRRAL